MARRWPPSPSVEDEESALAREHILEHPLTSKSEDQAGGCRGSVDQYPIILDVDIKATTSTDDNSSDNEDPVLSEIEARAVAHNARLHAQMIKANSGRSVLFTVRTIATLQIPLKLQLATKPSRLLVQILEHKNRQYKL